MKLKCNFIRCWLMLYYVFYSKNFEDSVLLQSPRFPVPTDGLWPHSIDLLSGLSLGCSTGFSKISRWKNVVVCFY